MCRRTFDIFRGRESGMAKYCFEEITMRIKIHSRQFSSHGLKFPQINLLLLHTNFSAQWIWYLKSKQLIMRESVSVYVIFINENRVNSARETKIFSFLLCFFFFHKQKFHELIYTEPDRLYDIDFTQKINIRSRHTTHKHDYPSGKFTKYWIVSTFVIPWKGERVYMDKRNASVRQVGNSVRCFVQSGVFRSYMRERFSILLPKV